MTKRGGMKFHREWNKSVMREIAELDLMDGYKEASEIALHSRPWGVASGILIGAKSKKPGEIRLIYQEVDNEKLLFFSLSRYLRFHCKVVGKCDVLHPELTEEQIKEIGIEEFQRRLEHISQRAIEIRRGMGRDGVLKVLKGNVG